MWDINIMETLGYGGQGILAQGNVSGLPIEHWIWTKIKNWPAAVNQVSVTNM